MAKKYKSVLIYAIWLLIWGGGIIGWLTWLGYKTAPLGFVEDSWWGNQTQMKRKAVVVWLDFAPSAAYSIAGETV